MTNDLKVLDCTLRDGGYINDWEWGFDKARAVINLLVNANIDIVEVGFLRSSVAKKKGRTVCETIEELNSFLPKIDSKKKTVFSAMAMQSNYDVSNLTPYCGSGIELIRITFHDYDVKEGLEFASKIKRLGYKVSVNPINVMGYSDADLLEIIRQVNQIAPWQFSIVDTFGSMKRRDLDRIVNLADNNLDKSIRLGLHLHENMSLSTCLAQRFADMHLNRNVSIDGSLMGMGRNPGNLPVELICDYLNDYEGKNYDLNYLMDAIQDYILPLHGYSEWGYNPVYFLSAHYNLHRNYAEFYLEKGTLTNRDINNILSMIEPAKKNVFDKVYAEKLYANYQNTDLDDAEIIAVLSKLFADKKILLLAPGMSLGSERKKIDDFIDYHNPLVVSVNFTPADFRVDYTFCNNNKRYESVVDKKSTVIATSNIVDGNVKYRISYKGLCGASVQNVNSLIMVLALLKKCGVESVHIAGADGYAEGFANYCRPDMRTYTVHGKDYNKEIAEALRSLGMAIDFVTKSAYEVSE